MEKLQTPCALVVFEALADPKLPQTQALVHYYQPASKPADNKVIYECVRLHRDACYIFQVLTVDPALPRSIKLHFEVLREQDVALEELKA